MSNEEALKRAKISLAEWCGMSEKVRDMKLRFAKLIPVPKGRGG